ncbi:hypothetical protein PCANC_05143 [Puccinia coronata f. sp. avenae]|uniref:DUF659 domain-containing protein n=1 Tax=Puccinia coronata f. sp. avenae TaxID=200324 RepID=A0A2N5W352_9BASI|nr:hypothetical protein PCANC_05143 [Puccinia coronata f. sp. avenae]
MALGTRYTVPGYPPVIPAPQRQYMMKAYATGVELQPGIAEYIILLIPPHTAPQHLNTTIIPRPRRPTKRARQESSPSTVSTPNAHRARSIASVSDEAATHNPIDVDKEHPGELLATPSASGGPDNVTTDQEELSQAKQIASTAKKHNKDHVQTLGLLGITGTGDIDLRKVTQKCAIWCAEAAQPFSPLEERSLKSILHPTVLKNLPSQHVVSKAIHILYAAVQEEFKLELKNHKGALYLGLDAWQSPNGFNILGIVVYWLNKRSSGKHKLASMPLDFIKLSHSHTGEYLAKTVQMVFEKFGIASKIALYTNNRADEVKSKDDEWEDMPTKGTENEELDIEDIQDFRAIAPGQHYQVSLSRKDKTTDSLGSITST